MMTQTRFEYLLDAYGTRWSAWPEAEREAGRALMKTSPRLQSLWSVSSELDVFLDTMRAPVVSAALREGVIASAAVAGLRERRRWGSGWAWLSGAGVAATAFAGAAFGVIIANQINSPTRADTVLYQASLNATDDTEVLGVEYASLSLPGR